MNSDGCLPGLGDGHERAVSSGDLQKRVQDGELESGMQVGERGSEPSKQGQEGEEEKKDESETNWQLQKDELVSYGNSFDEQAKEGAKALERLDFSDREKLPHIDLWIQRNLFIRTKVGARGRIALNLAQREYSRVCLREKSKRNIVLKARQMGMTTYIAARTFAQVVTHPGSVAMLVAHDREAAEEIFRIVHRFWDNFDPKWRKGALKTSHSSARELVFPRLDSQFSVAAADEDAGRGRTIQYLHCTEVSRWGHAEEALASLRAALVPQGEIVLESTANGAWGQFYQEWQQADETGYARHFFPWWFEESYVSDVGPDFELTEDEKALADLHGLSNRQIAWRRSQWAAMRGLAKQEFAEDATTCFKATGECAFELGAIEEALLKAGAPVATEDNHALLIWLPPQPGRDYVIGVDPAGGGVDGDYSCAEVIDRKSGMQCAELHGHFNPMELAKKVAELGNRYNLAQVAVESNNHGGSVLADLHNLSYPNIYVGEYGEGWLTSAKSRPPMIENLGWALLRDAGLFRSERFLNECRTFVRQKNGIPAAAQGAHDDCVMAMAIGWAVRAEGKKQEEVGHQPSAVSRQPSGETGESHSGQRKA